MSMMNNYLFFDGNCEEAMKFYQSVLGGELMVLRHGDPSMPAGESQPGLEGRTMHASLTNKGWMLMASDWGTFSPYQPMQGFAVSLDYSDPSDAKRIYDQLSEGGRQTMPFGKTFWAEAFGMCVDRFGTPWMVGGGEAKQS